MDDDGSELTVLYYSFCYSVLYFEFHMIVLFCLIGDFVSDPHTSGEFKKNRENGRKPSVENQSIPVRKDQLSERANPSSRDPKNKPPKKDEAVMKKQTTVDKPNKPSASDSGPRRPAKPALDHKASSYETKSQQRSDGTTLQKRSVGSPQNVSN